MKQSHCLTSQVLRSGVFLLRARESYSLGRDKGSDIPLPSGSVSRKHARIESRGGDWFLVDAGSVNGTRVNDRRVDRPTLLDDGDTIRIGPFELAFHIYEGDLSTLLESASDEADTYVDIMGGSGAEGGAGETLAGKFEGLSLIETCQFLAQAGKDGLLRVFGNDPARTKGEVLMFAGSVVWASGKESVEANARSLLGLSSGSFEFRAEIPSVYESKLGNAPVPMLPLLMDICRTMDED